MADSSVWRRIGSLALALLNATLILLALCLWLAWGMLSTAEQVSDRIAEAADTVLPLRAEIASLTEEVAAARADLAERRTEETDERATVDALEARIAGVEAQLTELTAAVTALGADPDALIDRVVGTGFEGLGSVVSDILSSLRGTTPPPDPGL